MWTMIAHRTLLLILIGSLVLTAQSDIPLTGVVKDAKGGEALAKVSVAAGTATTSTDGAGKFSIAVKAPIELRFSLVGYRTLRVNIVDPTQSLEVILTPDGLSQRDSVDVHEGPYQAKYESSASERTLTASELKNLNGVLANDPLRAVQSLPGVSSSNDYVASFAVRGADFSRVGIFLDGVLLNNPLHSTQGQQASGSLSMVNSDIIEELTLHTGAPPVPYMDRSAAALDMLVREGNTKGMAWRVNAGVAASTVLAEGPIPKGSWLVSVRKSYLQYILQKAATFDTLAFGFFDVQSKLGYNLTDRQHITLALFDGVSDLDRTAAAPTLGINSILSATYHFTNLQLGHRWTATDRLVISNKLAWMRERSENENVRNLPLGQTSYGEWVANSNLEWNWNNENPLRIGSSFRQQKDNGFNARYIFNPLSIRRRDDWGAKELRAGGFIEQGFSKGPLSVTLGSRFDGSTTRQPSSVSPHASARFRIGQATQLIGAWSQAVQYAPLSALTIQNLGNPALLPTRSINAIGGVEQALSASTRFRVEAYYRADRDLITQPLLEARLLENGLIFAPPSTARFENSVRGASRGVEVFLQRRSANRWNGWVSYGYSKTILRDGITGAHYSADFDQRHTVNTYLSYRLSASVNLSARYSYGTNFPIPGFFTVRNGEYYLSKNRNEVRLPNFSRADFRLNKQFERKRWRGVLFVEVMNLLNTNNQTLDSYNGYDPRTAKANISLLRLFPIVPAAGWMMDWGSR